MIATSRSRTTLVVALLGALFAALLTAQPASAAPLVEGYTLTTPSGGITYAGSQSVNVDGKTFVGICFDNGLPSPRGDARPELVVSNLDRYAGANFQRLARLHNDPRYASGKGATTAAALWGASNLLRSGQAGVDFKRVWDSHYVPQLRKKDARVLTLVAEMLADTATPLPANTFRYDSVTVTPAQPGRQQLGKGGMQVVGTLSCPPECVAQGLFTLEARNTTATNYLVQLINIRDGKELHRMELRPGQTMNAVPRIADGTLVRAVVRQWANGGWQAPQMFASFEVICPTPPPVKVNICTVCNGTTANVEVTNTTRRTVVVGVRIGSWTKTTQLAPGAKLPAAAQPISAPTLVRAETYVVGANGAPTGVKVTTEMEVRPGRVTPVNPTTTVAP